MIESSYVFVFFAPQMIMTEDRWFVDWSSCDLTPVFERRRSTSFPVFETNLNDSWRKKSTDESMMKIMTYMSPGSERF